MNSDLQCPATVVLVPVEMLHAGASVLTAAGARYAGVFAAGDVASDAGNFARVAALAQQVACRVEILAAAVDAASIKEGMGDLADLYRGETIIVIARRVAIAEVLRWAGDVMRPVAVAIDSAGWVVREL